MLSHSQIWAALDALAAKYGFSPSGLARRAGLDPTTFNRSKRTAGDGRPRWPSTESIAKVLEATGADVDEFIAIVKGEAPLEQKSMSALRFARTVPLIGLTQAGYGGFFDDGGFPAGTGWDEVPFPDINDENAYALEVSGESMLPLYRDGDIVIVSPAATIRRGDRVVVKTGDGEVMAKILQRRTARKIELASVNPEIGDRVIDIADIEWIARILWASQ